MRVLKVVNVRRAESPDPAGQPPDPQRATPAHGGAPRAVLAHDARHLRRKTIALTDHSKVLIDLPEPVALNDGDLLELEDGSLVRIEAAAEDLYDIRGRDAVHLLQLAWHIGNRHLQAELREDRILICRDHVIKAMLEGLGAVTTDIRAPFSPARGAYAAQPAAAPHPHHHH